MSEPIRVVRAAELEPADPMPGMQRKRAFERPNLWAGWVETAPGSVSGWHHHDVNETSIYVVSGVLSRGRAGRPAGDRARPAPARR